MDGPAASIASMPMNDEIERLPADQVDGDEGWVRTTDDPELRNLEAHRYNNDWQVTVWIADYLRDDPLESELREAMATALRAVPGVTAVHEEDREVWTVEGQPAGDGLLRAAAVVVDDLAARAENDYREA
jgi:hypothetical protein